MQTVESKWEGWMNEDWQMKHLFLIFEEILSLYQNTIIFVQFCYHSYVINLCLQRSFVIHHLSFIFLKPDIDYAWCERIMRENVKN